LLRSRKRLLFLKEKEKNEMQSLLRRSVVFAIVVVGVALFACHATAAENSC